MKEDESSEFYVYYRKAQLLNHNSRDHFVEDGEAFCDYGVKPPEPDEMKPAEEVSIRNGHSC